MIIPRDQLGDHLELQQLASRYGNLVDHAQWAALGEVLAEDVVFDLSGIKRGVVEGLARVQQYMEHEAIHPAAHLMSNVTVDALDEERGRMTCRLLAVQGDGTVLAGEYQDEVRRTADGWRFSRRTFSYVRRQRTPPQGSG